MSDEPKTPSNTTSLLFLLPTAITLAAFYKDVFEFGHLLADLARHWLAFWRVAWQHMVEALPGLRLSLSSETKDYLTLYATLLACFGLVPLLIHRSLRRRTTVEALTELGWFGPRATTFVAYLLCGFGLVVVIAPFLPSLSTVIERSAVTADARYPIRPELFVLLLTLSLPASFNGMRASLRRGPVLAGQLERIVTVAYGLGSALSLLMALASPPDDGRGQALLMATASVALLLILSIRTMLPFVQIAGLLGAIFLADAVTTFFGSVWQSVPH